MHLTRVINLSNTMNNFQQYINNISQLKNKTHFSIHPIANFPSIFLNMSILIITSHLITITIIPKTSNFKQFLKVTANLQTRQKHIKLSLPLTPPPIPLQFPLPHQTQILLVMIVRIIVIIIGWGMYLWPPVVQVINKYCVGSA